MTEMIEQIGDLVALRDRLVGRGPSIGFVATMGALHAGHLSLVERAALDHEIVVVSIFVNPLQFGSEVDLAHYPRRLAEDFEAAGRAGATAVFAPSVEQMFPAGSPSVTVDPGPYGELLEGIARPGHMRGVATIVTRLLSLVRPDAAYFGEKDFEQLILVRRLAVDLGFGVEIVGMPIVREPDGLAMSSRNLRLVGDDRRRAAVLYRAITHGAALLAERPLTLRELEVEMAEVVADEEGVTLDYATARRAADLSIPEELTGDLRLLIAATVGPVRLIDNVAMTR